MGRGRSFYVLAWVLSGIALAILGSIVVDLVTVGIRYLGGTAFRMRWLGMPLLNTLYMVGVAECITIPLAMAAAIARVEYHHVAPRAWLVFDRLTRTFLSIPSIVLGLLVFQFVIGQLGWPISRASGIIALVLFNWPFLIIVFQAALGIPPENLREASFALGATAVQTLGRVVLPMAWSDLIMGLGMSIARLMGESAALIFTAGLNASRQASLFAPGETLAVHLWYIRTEVATVHVDGQAAATGVVLLGAVLVVLGLTMWWGEKAKLGR